MDNCVFCKIAAGEIPSQKIYEDQKFLSFLDINPVSEGHALVIPKQHHSNFLESSEDVLDQLLHVSRKVAAAVVAATGAEGFNFSTNNGSAAGQTVEHLHFHIIPRKSGDGLISWPHSSYPEGRAVELAEQIKAKLS